MDQSDLIYFMLSFVIVLMNQDVIIYHMYYKQCGPSRSRGLFQGVAPPALLCHKETARRIQRSLLGTFCMFLAVSLWHKVAYNRTFPCIEANYSYAIKKQKAPRRGLWMRRAGSLWHKRHWRSNTMKLSTNESGPH